nr:ribonuclease H-like domain-containing protein [Tanacetum cinerariifolium]
MVRSLRYLTASRPNIVHATGYCARYQARPTEKQFKGVKWVFRYLKNTIHMGHWYPKETGFNLTAFSDSDHAGCIDTRKSTSGGIQFLCGDKMINCGFHFDKIPMYYESKAAITISCNPVQHSCTKHIDVIYHFIKEQVERDGVDLLIGDRSSNLYTIALNEVASNSSTCLLAKASSSKSWLWHQRLSHLNFATINNLVKSNLVQGLPKMKFKKDHLCSVCEQGKIHRKHHKSKKDFASNKLLYLLHMDLCGSMHVEGINEKRYVLVVVDDYSRYTWVFFLHSKDEASDVIISFIKKTQVNLQLQVQCVRTDNGTSLRTKLLLSSLMRLVLLKKFLLQERHNKMVSWKGGIKL